MDDKDSKKKSLKNILVLIVDDDIDVLETIEEMLKINGCKTMSASSGDEALKKISTTRPDFILLDIRMPKMNGVETLKSIKKFNKSIPVIMMTGYDDVGLARELSEFGAADYIYKPVNFEYLLKSISSKLTP